VDFTAINFDFIELEMLRRWADDRAEINRRIAEGSLIVPSINGGEIYPPSELSRFGL
jgi:hypothetical protein